MSLLNLCAQINAFQVVKGMALLVCQQPTEDVSSLLQNHHHTVESLKSSSHHDEGTVFFKNIQAESPTLKLYVKSLITFPLCSP